MCGIAVRLPICFLPGMALSLCLGFTGPCLPEAPQPVPVVYSTDLFHPPDDPDDHFDLATLLASRELEVKAVLLDQGARQVGSPGTIPLQQMARLTGKALPCAAGLSSPLTSPRDTGLDQPADDQHAVNLLLQVLRESPQPITIIVTGSARDVCAAFNREPDLVRAAVARLYLNMGDASGQALEWNVALDPSAYVGLTRSGLPILLCPCAPEGHRFCTHWRFAQGDVLESAPKGLQSFFIYALVQFDPARLDPLDALAADLAVWRQTVWSMERNIWSTASIFHAAGREIRSNHDEWFAAAAPPSADEHTAVFGFSAARVIVDDDGLTTITTDADSPNMYVFQRQADQSAYAATMTSALRELLAEFPPE